MHVFRELLDKQICDRDDTRMGRVDGIIVELRDDQPPRITDLELGAVTIARRLHPRLEQLAMWAHARLGIRGSARYRIAWSDVVDVDTHRVKVAVRAADTPATDWERWLRRNVVERIPGSSPEEEQ